MSGGQATRIFAIRHGETDWNAAARIQGHTDIALNARGLDQATRMAAALAGEPLAAIYASDLARAWQTAEPLAACTGAAMQAERGLRERHFGRFEGATFDQIEHRWPDEALRWRQRDPEFAPGGGENLIDFSARVIEVADQLAARHVGEAIALVTHGGVLDCLYRAATRLPLQAPRSWVLGNASINRLLRTEQGFNLVGWNDDAHLQEVGVVG